MRTRTLAILAAGLTACATRPDGVPVEIRTTETSYAPGATVDVVIENRSERELGYNLCAAMELDRREGESWTPVPRDPDRVCTMEVRLVPAGESRTGTVEVPADLAPGVYRFRFVGLVWTDGASPPPGAVVTEEFEVESARGGTYHSTSSMSQASSEWV